MASTPSDTSVATSVKTRSLLKPRSQYSVEVVDPEILPLLKVEGTPAGFGPLAFLETTNNKHSRYFHLKGINAPVRIRTYISTEPQALDKFTVFPRLPPELRIKIWKLSALPRIVMQIMLYSAFNLSENLVNGPLFTPCIPVLMHVNREARDVAGGLYEEIELAFHAGCLERRRPLCINFELEYSLQPFKYPSLGGLHEFYILSEHRPSSSPYDAVG
jgi:hypothetical protein